MCMIAITVIWSLLINRYRKWFLKALGVQQFHKLLAGFDDKSAQAVCTFAYCEGPGHEPIVFQGRTKVEQLDSVVVVLTSSRARS